MTNYLEQLESNTQPRKDDDRVLNYQKNGCLIQVGRNALSNEKIISAHPHTDCLWFHALGAKGSHVILCHQGDRTRYTDQVILYAATLALRNSRSELRSVNMARLEDLMRSKDGSVGMFWSNKTTQIEVP